MKTTHSIIRLCIVLLALALLLALLTLPVLAEGLAAAKGDPVQPEKLDVQPLPVPPPPRLAVEDQPRALATPSLSSVVASAPQPIPVPTPPVVMQTDSLLAQSSISPRSALPMIAIMTSQGAIAPSVLFVVLFILIWRYCAVSSHSLHQECAG